MAVVPTAMATAIPHIVMAIVRMTMVTVIGLIPTAVVPTAMAMDTRLIMEHPVLLVAAGSSFGPSGDGRHHHPAINFKRR